MGGAGATLAPALPRRPIITTPSPHTPDTPSPGLSLAALEGWHSALAEAHARCRQPGFTEALIAAIDRLVPTESTLVILEDARQAPRLLYQRGIPPEGRDRILGRYFSRGYLLDPFCLAVDQGLAEGFYHLDDIAPDNFFNSEYYRVYYLEAGSVEDCYYILDLTPERRISISLYNGLTATPLTSTQRAILQTLDPMVRTLARYHWQNLDERVDTLPPPFAPSPGGGKLREAFLRFGEDRLTMREREICHLLLRGHSAKSSARELSISPETVRLHRKNLYAKFDIGSQSALFAIFLDWLDG
ncbi:LuxR C-terminal-related transcriptional regulator [Halomonas elongata]|uniref:helix-turn-helix transcriptional regulator n=1 Tax=Halomonas elongata TaxID=2746 RepID=UPI00255A9465|nr:LuxR family transcriptional regulator [Halomonas elongata]MDL4861340.1 LuxR C-terminal-related transcriptional regulator [Halomonas elongata]